MSIIKLVNPAGQKSLISQNVDKGEYAPNSYPVIIVPQGFLVCLRKLVPLPKCPTT